MAAVGAAAPACEAITSGQTQVQAVCALPAGATGRLRFKAHFVGSHDDSTVELASALIDDRPLACAPGSKTASRFEDGEVTLDCGFTAPAGGGRRLTVTLALFHLQLDRIELQAD